MPTKHIKTENALIGVGAQILELLSRSQTVAVLFTALRQKRQKDSMSVIHFDWFLLALDFLYAVNAIKFENGLIRQANQ